MDDGRLPPSSVVPPAAPPVSDDDDVWSGERSGRQDVATESGGDRVDPLVRLGHVGPPDVVGPVVAPVVRRPQTGGFLGVGDDVVP